MICPSPRRWLCGGGYGKVSRSFLTTGFDSVIRGVRFSVSGVGLRRSLNASPLHDLCPDACSWLRSRRRRSSASTRSRRRRRRRRPSRPRHPSSRLRPRLASSSSRSRATRRPCLKTGREAQGRRGQGRGRDCQAAAVEPQGLQDLRRRRRRQRALRHPVRPRAQNAEYELFALVQKVMTRRRKARARDRGVLQEGDRRVRGWLQQAQPDASQVGQALMLTRDTDTGRCLCFSSCQNFRFSPA